MQNRMLESRRRVGVQLRNRRRRRREARARSDRDPPGRRALAGEYKGVAGPILIEINEVDGTLLSALQRALYDSVGEWGVRQFVEHLEEIAAAWRRS